MQNLIVSLFVLSCLFNQSVYATEVSFTIDDPGVQATSFMSHIELAKKILQTLKENELEVILFICGKRIDSSEGMKLLKLWNGQGHILANHSAVDRNAKGIL